MIGIGQLRRMNLAATVDSLIDRAEKMDWYPYDVIGEIESEYIAENAEEIAEIYDLDHEAESFFEDASNVVFEGPMYDWPEDALEKIEEKLREELNLTDEDEEEDNA